MVLKDTAPNEEIREQLVRWTGMLILLGRQTRLHFETQYLLIARILGVLGNEKKEGWEEEQSLESGLQGIIWEYLRFLPQEIIDCEGDLRRILLGCTKKETKVLLEEYYFQQTGDRIGKNDEVVKRIIEQGL